MGGRLAFYVTEPPRAAHPAKVACAAIEPRVTEWLTNAGVETVLLENVPADTRQIILVGGWNDSNIDSAARTDLMRRVAGGSVAVFLQPEAFRKGDSPVGWLPLKNKGGLTDFPDWLYHKECVAKRHAFFDGLLPQGVMDWDYYGPIITNRFFEGQDTPEDVAAAAFAVCHSSRPDGFASGVMLGVYPFGSGKFVLNTFRILDNIDKHPAADRMLFNLIAYASEATGQPVTPPPADLDATLAGIGY